MSTKNNLNRLFKAFQRNFVLNFCFSFFIISLFINFSSLKIFIVEKPYVLMAGLFFCLILLLFFLKKSTLLQLLTTATYQPIVIGTIILLTILNLGFFNNVSSDLITTLDIALLFIATFSTFSILFLNQKKIIGLDKATNLKANNGLKGINFNINLFNVYNFDNKIFYLTTLLLVALLGFFLRVWNLGSIDLSGDEYRHLNAMKHFFQNGYFEQPRSIFTTYLVIFTKYFVYFNNFFAFKLPFVLLGTLSIVLIFYVSNLYLKNKLIALFCAYLFATLPLAIGMARYIREYEIINTLMLLSIIIIKRINSIFISILTISFWILLNKQLGSTSRMALLFLIIIFFFQIFNKIKKTKWKIFLLFFSFFFSVLGAFVTNIFATLHTATDGFLYIFNFSPLYNVFDPNPAGYTWFIWLTTFWVIIFILTIFLQKIVSGNSEQRRQLVELLTIFVVTVFFCVFVGVFPFDWQPRYIYYLFPFYIIILSISFTSFIDLLKSIIKYRFLYITSSIIIFIIFFSPYNAINDLLIQKSGQANPFDGQQVYADKELCSYLNNPANKITLDNLIVARSWALDYCLNGTFLKATQKDKFIYFPPEEAYEYNDRENIFTITPYKNEDNLKNLSNLIRTSNFTTLVVSSLDSKDNIINQSPVEGYNFELIQQIPNSQSRYKYFIYKISKL